MRWIPAYIGLGSNLDEPRRQIETAWRQLAGLPRTRLIARSGLYRSKPLGPQNQPDFVNAAAGLLTELTARELLTAIKSIERAMGRETPAMRWGPRLIDLDLLVYGDRVMPAAAAAAGEPVLPHPGVHERNFVLYPLAQIAPTLQIPGHGEVAALARQVGSSGLQELLD